MSFGQNLRDLLTPLGVYRWEGSFQWGELQSEGMALDGVAETLAELQREMNLATAQGKGLPGSRPCWGWIRGPETRRSCGWLWRRSCGSAGTASPWQL